MDGGGGRKKSNEIGEDGGRQRALYLDRRIRLVRGVVVLERHPGPSRLQWPNRPSRRR